MQKPTKPVPTEVDRELAADPEPGTANMDRERSERFFNLKNAWTDNIRVGNWPYSAPHARPPVYHPYIVKGPPLLSGLVHWADPENKWLYSPAYRQEFTETYRAAYSTELAAAIQGQLVDGYWHELIHKGELEPRPHLNLSRYKTDG